MSYLPDETEYRNWLDRRAELASNLQSQSVADWNVMISVVIPVDSETPADHLSQTLESLRNQSWKNAEISLFPGNCDLTIDPDPFAQLRGLFVHSGQTLPDLFRFGAAKCGLRGDFVLVIEPGSVLKPFALFLINRAIVQSKLRPHPEIVLFDYALASDEPGIDQPIFLPGLDPDLLSCIDYIGNAAVIALSLFDRVTTVGNISSVSDILELTASTDPSVGYAHVADILLTKRTATRIPTRKPIITRARQSGRQTKLSVIIPNRDQPALLKQCITSLMAQGVVQEVVIVDNASSNKETLRLYTEYQKAYQAKIVSVTEPFNFSRMINLGVEASSGDMVLLLNNDVEFRSPGALAVAMESAARPDVGVVGSKLLYPDLTIQHAGVLIAKGPVDNPVMAMHIGLGAQPGSRGYLDLYSHPRNLEAVTGAFMMLRREVFDMVGGFDEVSLPVEYNDIDFCLRVREAGQRVLCLPLDGVIHHESLTRGKRNTPAVLRIRYASFEVMRFRWLERSDKDPNNHPVARTGNVPEVVFDFSEMHL
jgi:O-antigen biosynthesis protein